MFQFSCRFVFFLSNFRLSNRTPKNNANFDAKHAQIGDFFFKTCTISSQYLADILHDTPINKLLLMRPKSHHHRKWRKLRVKTLC